MSLLLVLLVLVLLPRLVPVLVLVLVPGPIRAVRLPWRQNLSAVRLDPRGPRQISAVLLPLSSSRSPAATNATPS